jgi:hypothetical protein
MSLLRQSGVADIDALMARTAALAGDAKARRAQRRLEMPQSAAIVDELTALFGPLPYGRLEEAGRVVEWGRRPSWMDLRAVQFSDAVKRKGAK